MEQGEYSYHLDWRKKIKFLKTEKLCSFCYISAVEKDGVLIS
jgi:hypothetical protein